MGSMRPLSSVASATARAGMRRVIDLGQVLKVQVRIDLGGAHVGVTEEFLNAA
jgi:hypothetical protein